MTRELILASTSPSRAAILDGAAIPFRQVPSDVDEERLAEQLGPVSPAELALSLARAKATDVAKGHRSSGALVLGCDSVLELDGQAHGKPGTPEAAARRWHAQRGRTGELITGHWLIDTAAERHVGRAIRTSVTFAEATDEEISDYVASSEPLHVAGAFTLEGRAGPLIERIDGDPSNVLGLSLPGLRVMLHELGVTLRQVRGSTTRPER